MIDGTITVDDATLRLRGKMVEVHAELERLDLDTRDPFPESAGASLTGFLPGTYA